MVNVDAFGRRRTRWSHKDRGYSLRCSAPCSGGAPEDAGTIVSSINGPPGRLGAGGSGELLTKEESLKQQSNVSANHKTALKSFLNRPNRGSN